MMFALLKALATSKDRFLSHYDWLHYQFEVSSFWGSGVDILYSFNGYTFIMLMLNQAL